MIEVPARVKDALKSGEYAKNVKIRVDDGISSVQHTEEHLCDVEGYEGPGGSVAWVGAWLGSIWWGTFDKLKVSMNGADSFTSITMFNISKTGDDIVVEDGRTCVVFDGSDIYADPEQSLAITTPGDTYPTLQFDYIANGTIIDNNNLVAESVKFDERMCSGDELKFGLCEGTSVEFQYFDMPNIRGEHISISIEVQYKNENGTLAWYKIPMGQFDVDECSRQASTGIIKAVAYNKLKSAYLDTDETAVITDMISHNPDYGIGVGVILKNLLDGYAIETNDYIPIADYTPVEVDADEKYDYVGQRAFYPADIPYSGSSSPGWPIGTHLGGLYTTYRIVPAGESGTTTDDYFTYEIDFKKLHDAVTSGTCLYVQARNGALDYFYNYEMEIKPLGNPYSVPTYGSPYFTGYVNAHGQGAYYIRENKDSKITIQDVTDEYLTITFIVAVKGDLTSNTPGTVTSTSQKDYIANIAQQAYSRLFADKSFIKITKRKMTPIEKTRVTIDDLNNKTTLRDIQSAVFEVNCCYGKLDRVTDLFAGIELNNGRLYPRDNLYPADNLYPMGTAEAGYPAMYNKLWADEGNVHSFRYLNITYKSTETIDQQTQVVEKKLQRTVHADGTDDYNMSDNWLFKNLVWTDADVGAYADAMVLKMQGISWFPFEMWCAGLPYLESGDIVEIAMKDGAYPSPVLRRTLSGIQNLQDEMINGTLDIF